MLQSMTGFGSARLDADQYSISVEIRSLNSKSMDLSVRIPKIISDHEYDIRNMVQRALVRGKVGVNIELSRNKAQKAKNTINKELLQAYYNELSEAADMVGASKNDLFRLALHMPEVLQQEQEDEDTTEADWSKVQPLLEEAIQNINTFRSDEGKALTAEIMSYIDRIRILLAEIDKHDPVRMENIRHRIKGHITELAVSEHFDQNRLSRRWCIILKNSTLPRKKYAW